MKTIGLVGGMSWESSAEYYRIINEAVNERCGKLHSAKIILYSLDFDEIEILQHSNKWEEISEKVVYAAQRLEIAGADLTLLCTNTIHKVAESVDVLTTIPFIHIADAAADEIKKKGLSKIALLGTKFTMEEDFYKSRLEDRHGLTVIIPPEDDRNFIHKVIYNELCLGKMPAVSKKEFLRIIDDLVEAGAEGVILGCTEIPLLIKQADTDVPLFDTTTIHAMRAVEAALAD